MKKIAIDLDGVVFDSENLFRVYTEIYDVDINHKDNIIDNSQKLFQKRYNWDQETIKKFYDDYALMIIKDSNFMSGAEVILKKLINEFEIIIVTSRNDIETEIARERLNYIGLNNIKIFNNDHDKINRFLMEKVDYIIDDDDIICSLAADNNICSLYFKNNACSIINKNNLITVNNWGEIYKFLLLK